MIRNHLRVPSEKLDTDILVMANGNFIILGDFNIEMEEQQIKAFCDN